MRICISKSALTSSWQICGRFVLVRLVATKVMGCPLLLKWCFNQGLVKELILEGKISKIRDVMEAVQNLGIWGTFDQSFIGFVRVSVLSLKRLFGSKWYAWWYEDQVSRLVWVEVLLSHMDTSLWRSPNSSLVGCFWHKIKCFDYSYSNDGKIG